MKMSIRAIIVDDDLLARNLLASLVDWQSLGYELLGEAGDGQEALALCQRLKPDVLFLDVSMPRMDGIVLMQTLSGLAHMPYIVVVSSYSNYEFVRETFRMGAVDYLLKDDLNAQRFTHLLKELRLKLPSGADAARDTAALRTEAGEFDQEQALSLFLCGIPFMEWREEPAEEDTNLLMRSIQSLILQLVDPAAMHYLRWLRPGALYLLTGESTDGETERRIRQCLQMYLDTHVEILRLETCPKEAESALLRAESMLFGDRQARQPTQDEHRLLAALKHGDSACAFSALSILREKTQACHPYLCAAEPMIRALLNGFAENDVEVPLGQLQQQQSLEAFFDWIKALLASHLSKAQRYSAHVQGAIAYIQAHYRQPITLGKIARHVNVVPSYLSTSFHNETGCTFVDYLNRHRIFQAQKLLSEQGSAIKDVYHQVGFNSYNYFFKVYRQVTGESPAGRSRSTADGDGARGGK